MLDLFARHLVGHDEHDAIALRDADLRKAEAGIAGGRLDDGAAGLQPAVALPPPRSWHAPERSLIEPAGFALSSLRNSRHGPVSKRVSSTSGVSPMRSRTEVMKTYTIHPFD